MGAMVMRLREYSEVGYLMQQWLGVLVPGAFREEVRRAAKAQGKSVGMRTVAPRMIREPGQYEDIRPITAAMIEGERLLQRARDTKLCACSRVVPEREWVYPHDCCSDCAARLDDIADNHREFARDADRDRLIDEERD